MPGHHSYQVTTPLPSTWLPFLSLLHSIHHCSQTMTKLLFCKKTLSFAKHDEKRSTHYSWQTAVFANVCSNWKYGEKSSLRLSKDRLPLVNAFCEKVFHETLTNHDESLSTHYWCFVAVSSYICFCGCSQTVCSGLYLVPSHACIAHDLVPGMTRLFIGTHTWLNSSPR